MQVETVRKLAKKEKAVDSWVTFKALAMNGKEAPFYVMGAVGAIMVCKPAPLTYTQTTP